MNIEFLEWKIEKAEGFELVYDYSIGGASSRGKYNRIQYLTKYAIHKVPLQDIERWIMYPLLLQRAIEGVNRENGGFFIAQHCDDLYVYNAETIHDYQYYYFKDMTTDQAKESALQYVYEQEVKP